MQFRFALPLALLVALAAAAGVSAQVDIRSSSCPNLIQNGQKGQCVTALQNLLIQKGFSVGATGADGDFGPGTLSAVKSFQSSRGLSADGVVGPDTKNALYASSPGPAPGGSATCSAAEFSSAITSNGFRAQPDSKRSNMLASIQRLGGASVVASKRELAMFMAQVIHESVGLGTIKEIGGESASYAPYYGRGYIQLTGQSNYQSASTALYGDSRLVTNPDQILANDNVAWDVTTYYWKTRVHSLAGVSTGQFGATTKGINGNECRLYPDRSAQRCTYYKKVLVAFGINETADCSGCL